MKKFTLGKEERLKSRKQIEFLFSEGKKFTIKPLMVFYQTSEAANASLQIGTSVSSRHFKKAVDRNKIKRWIREAWRLQKNEFSGSLKINKQQLAVFIIYTGREIPAFIDIKETVKKVLSKLDKIVQPSI